MGERFVGSKLNNYVEALTGLLTNDKASADVKAAARATLTNVGLNIAKGVLRDNPMKVALSERDLVTAHKEALANQIEISLEGLKALTEPGK